MTPTSPKIIFFGTEDHSLGTLKVLVENGFSVAAVVTKPDAPRGRGQKIAEPPVKTYAKQRNITVWQPEKLRDIIEDIRAIQPVAGVLVAYGKIIPQSIIDLFEPGIINVHPSLLPKWRGPSPIESAIASQDTETGVSIMKLDARMDGGPVYIQKMLTLGGEERKPELYKILFDMGNALLCDNLVDIISGKLKPSLQNDEQASYCSMLSKDMSIIDPLQMSAKSAEAHIRAHLGFPRSRIQTGEHILIVTRAHVSDQKGESPLAFLCQDNNYLIIDELIAPSGKTMSAEDFLRGYRVK